MKGTMPARLARSGAAAVLLATLALSACGGDDSESEPDTLSAVETELIKAINDVRESEPAIEAVDCPEVDMTKPGETAECELSGGDETGTLEITVTAGNTLDYSGSFGTSGFGGTGVEVPR